MWMGGAIDRYASGHTAVGHRGARAFTWRDRLLPGEDPVEPAAEWVRRVFDATAPFASAGVYVNALDAGRPVSDAYAEEILRRLIAVKRRYDPEGVFDAHGIRP